MRKRVKIIVSVDDDDGMNNATRARVNTLHNLANRVVLALAAMATGSIAHAIDNSTNGINGPGPVIISAPDGGSSALLLSAGAVGSLLVIRRLLKK